MNTTNHFEASAIRHTGMGGFLNPPTHPEHTMCIETDLKRKTENRGSMSLTAALESAYISPSMKGRISNILTAWEDNKPALTSPEIQDWILKVLGYFSNSQRGVKHIQEYYPDYQPSEKDFKNSYLGTK